MSDLANQRQSKLDLRNRNISDIRRELDGCEDLDVLEAFAASAIGKADSEWVADRLFYIALRLTDPFARLKASVVLKEFGHADVAYHILAPIVRSGVADESTSVEFIRICRRLRRDKQADLELWRLVSGNSFGERVAEEIIFRTHLEQGARANLRLHFLTGLDLWKKQLRSVGAMPAHIERFLSFAERAKLRISSVTSFYDERRFANPYEVYRAIDKAIATEKPFAFVRLGDGEGAVMTDAHDRWLFHEHRCFFLDRWFGGSEAATSETLDVVLTRLKSTLFEADIIGVPERSWVYHEIDNRNVRSFMACFNILYTMSDILKNIPVTNTSMNLDLAYRSLLDKLICKAKHVILVTSHANLGKRLCGTLGVEGIQSIIIPPAHSDLVKTGYKITGSTHLDKFDQVCAELSSRVRVGTLVIIGAGILGKAYCLAAKRAGGVAVDIGSVADLWMGFETRPTFQDLQHLHLE